jgi:glycosyltransferase involved in cell wall biosynthesis
MTWSAASKRLRVAVLNRTFVSTGGGAERYSIALVEQLAQRHEIHVFAQEIDHKWPGVTYHRLPRPFVKPRWLNQLWFALASWWATRCGFDVVHSHENTWHGEVQTVHVLPVRYSLFLGRTGFGLALRWAKVATSPRLLAYLWLERARYAVHDRRWTVATSPSLAAIMAQTYPDVKPRLKVITPGVSKLGGVAIAQARCDARAQLGLPSQGQCVLFVGNDYKKKGLLTLVNAFGRLPAHVHLVVVGNGSQIPFFEALVKEKKLGGRVHFLGAQRDMDTVYVAADCLAHPTLEDTFAMVVLESLAHGLPVVVSGAGHCGISGLLEDGKQAIILHDPLNGEELANAINAVLANPLLRQTLSTAGVEFAQAYLWSEIAEQQEQIYFNAAKDCV